MTNNKQVSFKAMIAISVLVAVLFISMSASTVNAAIGNLLKTISNPSLSGYNSFGSFVASTPSDNLIVGSDLGNSVYIFDGRFGLVTLFGKGKDSNLTIDEIYFYSRALSAEEVNQRFQKGNSLRIMVEAVRIDGSSFGRNFNTSVVTTDDKLFSQNVILDDNLKVVGAAVIDISNISGIPEKVSVTSNSCTRSANALPFIIEGVYC